MNCKLCRLCFKPVGDDVQFVGNGDVVHTECFMKNDSMREMMEDLQKQVEPYANAETNLHTELKPCPFCGAKPNFKIDTSHCNYNDKGEGGTIFSPLKHRRTETIECKNVHCKARPRIARIEVFDAATLWNARAESEWRWIESEKDLPKQTGRYLLMLFDGYMDIDSFYLPENLWSSYGETAYGDTSKKIVAWRKLPPPAERGEK